ncbi:MAG: hypothetical protein ABSB29_06485 [Nitrososphaerales archaeon]|jgi:thymidylate kinase
MPFGDFRGRFISIEGVDNTGKSTICADIKAFLEKEGNKVTFVNDPPMVEPWKSWKETITGSHDLMTPARAMLFLAGRLDAVSRIIRPAQERKETVLADRFIDSWFAYQLNAFEKFMSKEDSYNLLLALHKTLLSSGLLVEPDRTYLIIGEVEKVAKRGKDKTPSVYDDIGTQAAIQANFLWLAERFGRDRIRILKLDGKTSREMVEEIRRDLAEG